MRFKILILSLFCFWIVFINLNCAAERQTENYPFTGTNPLTLTAENHPHGYSKSSCFQCHLPQNIHQIDHLKDPSFSMANSYVEQKGLSSCSGCHGSNGVTP